MVTVFLRVGRDLCKLAFPATMKSVSGDSTPIFYSCACLEQFFIILFGAFFRAPSGCACLIFINILRCLVGFWLFFSAFDLFGEQECGHFGFGGKFGPYVCGRNCGRDAMDVGFELFFLSRGSM